MRVRSLVSVVARAGRGCPYVRLTELCSHRQMLRGVVNSCLLTGGSVEAAAMPAIDLRIIPMFVFTAFVALLGSALQVGERGALVARQQAGPSRPDHPSVFCLYYPLFVVLSATVAHTVAALSRLSCLASHV